jgi:hypothetical protein
MSGVLVFAMCYWAFICGLDGGRREFGEWVQKHAIPVRQSWRDGESKTPGDRLLFYGFWLPPMGELKKQELEERASQCKMDPDDCPGGKP